MFEARSLKKLTTAAMLAAVSLLFRAPGPAEAALALQRSAGMGVAIGVGTRCAIASSDIAFPNYVPTNPTPLDATGFLTVDCDAGRRTAVRIGQGLNPGPGSTARNPLRRLAGPTAFLNYNLYEDAARTIVWDDHQPGVMTVKVYPLVMPVYARIFAGQLVPNGTYQDAVAVRLFY